MRAPSFAFAMLPSKHRLYDRLIINYALHTATEHHRHLLSIKQDLATDQFATSCDIQHSALEIKKTVWPPPPRASTAVFNKVELLEDVLNQLPCKAIVRAQQVNKYRQAVITGSKNLRQRIFLEPIACEKAYEDELRDSKGLQKKTDWAPVDNFPKSHLKLTVQLHPTINKIDLNLLPTGGNNEFMIDLKKVNYWCSTGLRDMLLFQPPIKYIYGGTHRWEELKVATGITFGALHDWMMDLQARRDQKASTK